MSGFALLVLRTALLVFTSASMQTITKAIQDADSREGIGPHTRPAAFAASGTHGVPLLGEQHCSFLQQVSPFYRSLNLPQHSSCLHAEADPALASANSSSGASTNLSFLNVNTSNTTSASSIAVQSMLDLVEMNQLSSTKIEVESAFFEP